MKVHRKKLEDMLLEEQLVTAEQIRECMAQHRRTGKSLPQLLVEKEYLSEEDLVVTLSEHLGVPHIRVLNYRVPKEVLETVPEALARQYQVLPLSLTGDVLTLAMADPLNIMAIDDLRIVTGHEIEPMVAVMSELNQAIDQNYSGGKADVILRTINEGLDRQAEVEEVTAPGEDWKMSR